MIAVTLDGEKALDRIEAPQVLDTPTPQGRLPLVVAVLVPWIDGRTRARELPGNRVFADAGGELLPQMGLDHRRAFNDLRHLRVYAQMTADGRLVFGGRGAPYRLGSRMTSDLVDGIHGKIHDTLVEFFPALRDVRITHRWGGALGVARDFCPSVGLDPATGLARAGGYVGDGVATSNLAGRILRNLILKRDEGVNRLPIVNHRSPLWEREPLRWLGVNFGLTAAGIGDAEERLTRRPSQVAKLLEALTGAH